MNCWQRSRLPFLTACLLAAALAACAERPTPPSGKARRAILITCDTLRADHLGVYGYAHPTSPELDAFAAGAVVFDEAYTTAPWTKPAIAALLTGRTPDEIATAGGNIYELPEEATTLAEMAQAAGYRTAAFVSNWILRRPKGKLSSAGVAQGFERYDDEMLAREANRDSFERDARATTDAVLKWLEQQADASDDQFFLWVHYQDPHGPYVPPPEVLARFQRPPSGEALPPLGHTHEGRGQVPDYQVLAGLTDPESYRARYDAEIAWFDENLGRLLAGLRSRGWLDDSLIAFTADHGESLGEHGFWFCHGESLAREVVRVPLIVRFPANALHVRGAPGSKGEHVTAAASHMDLLPTFVDALGLPPNVARGTSLFGSELPERFVGQCFKTPEAHDRWAAVSDGRWRIVCEGAQPPRLYDLRQDSGEMHDLAASEPKRVSELSVELERWLAPLATPLDVTRTPSEQLDQRALRKLGYTDGDSK